ncbi:MAG: hypothetical protein ACK4Q5_13015 [Saprospiraceae bacterium]
MAETTVFQEFIELIASTNPEKIAHFVPSAKMKERVQELLVLKSSGEISSQEETELSQFMFFEKVLGLAKARAHQLLQAA